jgi:hypothetical protein
MYLRILPVLFSYQILVVTTPAPSLELLLQTAIDESATRARTLETSSVQREASSDHPV